MNHIIAAVHNIFPMTTEKRGTIQLYLIKTMTVLYVYEPYELITTEYSSNSNQGIG